MPMRRLMMALLLANGLMLGGCAGEQNLELQGDARDIALVVDAASAQPSETLSTAISRTSRAFITVLVMKPSNPAQGLGRSKGLATGSGFFVDSAGTAMTAGHVAIAPGMKVSARASDRRIHDGKVLAVSTVPDIGLLKLKNVRTVAVMPAASPCLRTGETVYSLGRPRKQRETARIGELVSMHFSTPVRYGKFGYDDAMVLRLNTRRGESGGPLFNARGELVGMIVSTLSRGGRSLHLAHAIPLTALARFYCTQGNCSARWRKLANMSTRNCPPTAKALSYASSNPRR